MRKFKKFLLISVLFAFIMSLTSCFEDKAYKVILNDDYNIRVIQKFEDSDTLDVDEYYYTEDGKLYHTSEDMEIIFENMIHVDPNLVS